MKEFLETLVKLEVFKERPGLCIAIICIFTFLFQSPKISEFINSIYTLCVQRSQRKYLKFKEIYEDPLASEENKNIAKGQLDALDFEKATGIKASPELVSPLTKLRQNSQNQDQITLHIRRAIRFLEKGYDGLPRIRPEKIVEKCWRFFNNIYGCFFLGLSLSILYAIGFWKIPSVAHEICMWILFLVFGFCSFIIFSHTGYVYSLKRIQEEITFISNNQNLNKKNKLKSWWNNLRRK